MYAVHFLDGVAFNLPSEILSLNSEIFQLYFSIDVINDTSTTGDRYALLGVEALDDQFIVMGGTATIRFIDEQGTRYVPCTLAHSVYTYHGCVLTCTY